jgi:hypothetical protein
MIENKKLSRDQKMFVLQRLAQFDSPSSIQLELMNLYGVDCTVQNICKNYQNAYADEIKALRDTYLSSMADLPAFHKKWRIDKRQFMVIKAMAARDYGTANRILDSILEELESKKIELSTTCKDVIILE